MSFSLNDFGVQMFRFGKKYSMNLKGAFQLNKVSHSGGLINIDSFRGQQEGMRADIRHHIQWRKNDGLNSAFMASDNNFSGFFVASRWYL